MRFFRTRKNNGFRCVVSVGDEEGKRTISSELMHELIQATQKSALDALDRRYGTEAWCSEIESFAALEGPSVSFILKLTVQPGESQVSMTELVAYEFKRSWNVSAQRLLT